MYTVEEGARGFSILDSFIRLCAPLCLATVVEILWRWRHCRALLRWVKDSPVHFFYATEPLPTHPKEPLHFPLRGLRPR
jgi:hypothetical protein